jgi:mannosyltransferase OCH1-like enzyme
MTNIPKKIHLIYMYKDQVIPDSYRSYYNTMEQLHPEWEILIYNHHSARQIIADNMPTMLVVYDCYELDVQRADLFRLLAVYLFGGFYMDLDMLCLKSLNSLCKHQLLLGEERTFTDEECNKNGCKNNFRIANYMFGSIAGHPFWLHVMEAAIIRSDIPITREEDVLNSTGPGLLTDIYHDYKSLYDDITLIENPDRKCLKACEAISCHFGDYAAHFHHGTWRWGDVLP